MLVDLSYAHIAPYILRVLGGCGSEHLITTPLGLVVMCTGMATVWTFNLALRTAVTWTTVGGDDTGVIRDSYWRDE